MTTDPTPTSAPAEAAGPPPASSTRGESESPERARVPIFHGRVGPALARRLSAAQKAARSIEATAHAQIRKDGKVVGEYDYVPWSSWIREGRRLLAEQGLYCGVVGHQILWGQGGGRPRIVCELEVVCPDPYEVLVITIETAPGDMREASKAEAVGRTAAQAEALRALLMLDGGAGPEDLREAEPGVGAEQQEVWRLMMDAAAMVSDLPMERRGKAYAWLAMHELRDVEGARKVHAQLQAMIDRALAPEGRESAP